MLFLLPGLESFLQLWFFLFIYTPNSIPMTPKVLVEIAAFTPGSALTAAQAGAHRVELCSGYAEGGLSPSAGSILWVRERIQIPLHVMIRPRIGDFCYSPDEVQLIRQDLAFCKQAGADGVVFGALSPQGSIDQELTKRILDWAYPMNLTFHRAFDLCPNQDQALEDLIRCGVKRVLTSGGKSAAPEALPRLSRWQKQYGHQIIILPGGGINPQNVRELLQTTGLREIHFSGKKIHANPLNAYHSEVKLSNTPEVDDYCWYESDLLLIEEMLRQVDFFA